MNSYSFNSSNKFNKKPSQPQEDVYKKVCFLSYLILFDNSNQPLPIDTINKFWGVDSRILKHDDTVQKQSFDQSYKNFWSFVEFNSNANMDNVRVFSTQTMNGTYNKTNTQGLSYLEARRRADEIIRSSK